MELLEIYRDVFFDPRVIGIVNMEERIRIMG